METASAVANTLLSINAVSLSPDNPYTWSSGLKSPIYCDNRLLLSFPDERKVVYEALAEKIKQLDVDVVAGTATAGIPHAAWAAEKLGLPMAYVRSSSKGHGKQNKIEGKIAPGSKVVIIEDLISTGGSAFNAAQAVEEAGAEIAAVIAVFTYELEAAETAASEKTYPVITLTSFSELAETAAVNGDLTEQQLESLKMWQKNPESWSTAYERQEEDEEIHG
ncbi:orotate phosphoribosyltransferase [Alkalicoccus saliphilus]|uniref:Orotate phosphoribosyltransferase n=1 Tax=Alkalicoccus saliphilus TaxID=200989 RepID=A0A2T4U8I2_9BACI|nr:orotate phosphoribosyltransferase [Alkalicoccus saliphilus]PTL39690.1 orotate phosphoribosyltransferase [Alkalicoccus saliphilus]